MLSSNKSSAIRLALWAAFAALLSGFTSFLLVRFALEEQLRKLARVTLHFLWHWLVMLWFSPFDHISIHPHLWKWCKAHSVAIESGVGIFLAFFAILIFLHWAQVNSRQRKILVGLLLVGVAYAGSIQVYLGRSIFYPEDFAGNLGGAGSTTQAAINAAITNGGGSVWLTKPDAAGVAAYDSGNNTITLGNISGVAVDIRTGAGVSLQLSANGTSKRGLIFYQNTVFRGTICPRGSSTGNNHASRIVQAANTTQIEMIGPAAEDGSMQGNVLECVLVDANGQNGAVQTVAAVHEQGLSGNDMKNVTIQNFGSATSTIGLLVDNSFPNGVTIPNTAIASVNQVAGAPSVVTVTMNTGASQVVPNNPWTTFLSTAPTATDNMFVTLASCNPNSNGINAQFQITAVTATTFTFTNPTSATQAYTACTYTVQSHSGAAGASQGITSVITHYQIVVSGRETQTSTRPVVIICNCSGGSGTIETNWYSLDVEAPSAGGVALEVNGNAQSASATMRNFFAGVTHVELRGLANSFGVSLIDTKNTTFDAINLSGGGGAGTEAVDISNTTGSTQNLLLGPIGANSANLIIDHVTTCAANPCTIPGTAGTGTITGQYSVNNWTTGALRIVGNQVSPTTSTNFEGMDITCMNSALSPACAILNRAGGTGTQRNLTIGNNAAAAINFYNSGIKWIINSSSNFIANTDNTLSIGAAGANRPSSIFLGTSAVSPLFNGQGDNSYQIQGLPQVIKLTADFTDASSAALQPITGLSLGTVPANTAMNISFDCHIMWSQATNVSDQFGIQDVTIAPTRIDAYAVMSTAGPGTGAPTYGVLTNLTTTTATAIVTATPTVTTFNYVDIHGLVQHPSNATPSAINMQVQQSTAGDLIVVRAGSWCRIY